MVDGAAITQFVQKWVSDYLQKAGEDIRRLVSDPGVRKEIFSLPRRISVDDNGEMTIRGGDLAFRLLEFGSSGLGVPALGLLDYLKSDLESEIEQALKKGGML